MSILSNSILSDLRHNLFWNTEQLSAEAVSICRLRAKADISFRSFFSEKTPQNFTVYTIQYAKRFVYNFLRISRIFDILFRTYARYFIVLCPNSRPFQKRGLRDAQRFSCCVRRSTASPPSAAPRSDLWTIRGNIRKSDLSVFSPTYSKYYRF